MRSLVAVLALWSMSAFASDRLDREAALHIAERTVLQGGANLGDYALSKTRRESSGEWSFLYECVPRKPDCRFFVFVNSATGRARIAAKREPPRHKQTAARTEAALASRSKVECEANQGVWFQAGLANQEFCDVEAPDAGKECTDGAQCEAGCITEADVSPGDRVTGQCDRWHHRLGRCVAEVHSGTTRGALCVD